MHTFVHSLLWAVVAVCIGANLWIVFSRFVRRSRLYAAVWDLFARAFKWFRVWWLLRADDFGGLFLVLLIAFAYWIGQVIFY